MTENTKLNAAAFRDPYRMHLQANPCDLILRGLGGLCGLGGLGGLGGCVSRNSVCMQYENSSKHLFLPLLRTFRCLFLPGRPIQKQKYEYSHKIEL